MPDSHRDAAAPSVMLRSAYRPPAVLVDQVDLTVELDRSATLVRSRLALRRNPAHDEPTAPLRLDGEALELLEITLDGIAMPPERYTVAPDALTLHTLPDECELELLVRIAPERNTELSGLYVSGGNFFTQCEAEGFRRITFFPDRPDVMARYTTTLVADRAQAPVLLSNGNPVDAGETSDGRHWAKWEDPHPKPSYLFALVAGDLQAVRDRFTTASGREVSLAIWVRAGDEDKCGHAMDSLKRSMRWDETAFGLEYDLDVFNIAAVSDFNMGAMENKGLNVFNTKYVLARPETATDGDYEGVETVIAHEYFHNWTGNRVTCRDWFQLSLKEGLTVFRDQQFSADQGSRAVRRINDVRRLRAAQFPEDAGPLAHPVRPDSYVKIDNFYTATVYQKGAEVVRMIHTLVGAEGFRRGMALYIARHDNQAVTIEAFCAAMADASGVDLSAMAAWYAQAGTPVVEATMAHAGGRMVLTLRQSTAPTPGQAEKRPLPIPIAIGLVGPDGTAMPVRLEGEAKAGEATRLLMLDQAEQRFVLEDAPAGSVPSLLRGFSAPVRLTGLSREALRRLAAHDTDPFVRWDSGQQYATGMILELVASGAEGPIDDGLVAAARATLAGAEADPALAAEALALPWLGFVTDQMPVAEHAAVHAVRRRLRAGLGTALATELLETYHRLADPGPCSHDGAAIGRRSLRNACLDLLAARPGTAGTEGVRLAWAQFAAQANMTDVLAALVVLAGIDCPERQRALATFYERWQGDELVLDKWFAIQASASLPGAIDRVRALMAHPAFELRNPNRVRSVLGAFAGGNPVHFHDASGAGYRLLADAVIALDPGNGQLAARLSTSLGGFRRQPPARAGLMRAELARILAAPGLSGFTREMASRSLG